RSAEHNKANPAEQPQVFNPYNEPKLDWNTTHRVHYVPHEETQHYRRGGWYGDNDWDDNRYYGGYGRKGWGSRDRSYGYRKNRWGGDRSGYKENRRYGGGYGWDNDRDYGYGW
ncbi:hypothetical protein C0992_012145, partial [Termitomyces sp. T32_za158]